MHAEAAVDARAREADENAEFWGGPLRRGGVAIAAEGVSGFFLDSEELFWTTAVSAGPWASSQMVIDGEWLSNSVVAAAYL